MKAILLLILTGVLFSIRVEAKDLSRDEALKIGHDNDGPANGEFWFEHGDASPPFTHAGRIIISRGSAVAYAVNDGTAETMVDAPSDDGSQTRVDFFTSAKGQGWVTAHVLKPEVPVKPPEPPRDERPAEHRYLTNAAELAIEKNDTVFLKSLFKHGLLINEALDFEKGNSLLHEAVWSGKTEMVKFLLKNGAQRDIQDRSGSPPIEAAILTKQKTICNLLAKPGGKEKKIDGIPTGLIAKLLPHDPSEAKELHFISWNGQDPPAAILAEMTKSLPKARPESKMKTLDRWPQGARSSYQDADSKEFGTLIQIDLQEAGDHWTATIRTTTGPALAGGGQKVKLRKAYGYWYTYDEEGWDE